jgi:hypothetical protein
MNVYLRGPKAVADNRTSSFSRLLICEYRASAAAARFCVNARTVEWTFAAEVVKEYLT